MNILLVNDDGYSASGINILYELLSKEHKVVIVAPNVSNSAKSVAITLGTPIKVAKVNDYTFSCSGTPADCVAFGLSSLSTRFDLVISGINHGLNVSYDTMYSGTVGAALQALTYRIPAIAISCDSNFEIVKKYLNDVMEFIKKNNLLSTEYLLNINFPLGHLVEDIKLSHIYYRKEVTYYAKDNQGGYLALRNINDQNCEDEDSDVYMVHHHQVSITKINKVLG